MPTPESSSVPAQLYRLLFDSHPQPMWIHDSETLHFLAVNEAAIAHYGYSRTEFLNMTIADIRPREERQALDDKLARTPDGPEKSGVWRHRLRNGRIILVEVASHPLEFEGRPARLVMAHDVTALRLANQDQEHANQFLGGTAIDTTRQQHAEQILREQAEQLRQTHELLSFHVDNSPLAVVEWDHEFRVKRWSPQSEEFFGWRAEEVLGLHPDDVAAVDAVMAELLDGSVPRNLSSNRNLTKTGEVRHCEWYNSVRLDEQSRVVSIFSLIHDITDRVRAETELQRLNAELEQRVRERTARIEAINKELESFSYSVSHDLRTPLRGIAGFAQALEEHPGAVFDDTGRGYLQRVRNAADRMGQLIDDLLQLSRLSRAEMHVEPVDLSALAASVIDELRQLEPERRVEVVVAPDVLVQGDARLLRILLQNLLGNAWKFSARNPQARIEFGIRYSAANPPACFVRDNGVGFDMRYSRKLFGAFQRLHAQTEFPGTGIGLATVQRIISRHDGRIWAEAEPNRGATFHFLL